MASQNTLPADFQQLTLNLPGFDVQPTPPSANQNADTMGTIAAERPFPRGQLRLNITFQAS
jgi:hypothetical protein